MAAGLRPRTPTAPPMQAEQFQQLRAERVITTGRVFLSAFSLLALWLDPSEPARYAGIAYSLVACYLVYSLILAAVAARAQAPQSRFVLATHGFDLVAFAAVLFFSEGATSPFFAFFVFALVSAALRWQWRGTLWTAAAALVLFLGIGAYSARFLPTEGFELNRFIIRSVYLAVVAVLLGYLSFYEKRVRREISRLAGWSRHSAPDLPGLAREILVQAAQILEAPRAVLVWEEPEEPGPVVARWNAGAFSWTREPPDAFEPPVARSLTTASFLAPDPDNPDHAVLRLTRDVPGGIERWHGGAPVHPRLRALLGGGPLLALALVPEPGRTARGWLLLGGRSGLTSDDLVVGEVVAGIAAAQLTEVEVAQRLQDTAAMEERLRLARDLHDGVIQSLTGAALRLQTARRLIERSPAEAETLLAETGDLLAAEQRELREFVSGELASGSLEQRLAILAERMDLTWGLTVELDCAAGTDELSPALAHEVSRIVQEAMVNAARHGAASTVLVAVRIEDGCLHLTVADDGRGFPFEGSYAGQDLVTLGLGPETIRQRLQRLGGSLAIDSGAQGARLTVTVPLGSG